MKTVKITSTGGEYLAVEVPDGQTVTNINWTTEHGQIHVRLESTNQPEGA